MPETTGVIMSIMRIMSEVKRIGKHMNNPGFIFGYPKSSPVDGYILVKTNRRIIWKNLLRFSAQKVP